MAIQDASEVTRSTRLETDICVVGGGPAGISLALRIAESTSLRVVMLESGALTADAKAQQLNEGSTIGLDYYDLTVTRHRVLGGASHKWAGWSRPLDPLDFEKRDWVPDSGWPITYDDMKPYYQKAIELCQLESDDWTPKPEMALPPLYRPPFVGGDVEIALWQGSPPTKFGITYRDQLTASTQITTILNATVVEVLSDDDGRRATGVKVASLSGNEFTVAARVVVLAAGAMETARLLLASNNVTPAGLANENDTVGRYFMEHPHLVTGHIELFPGSSASRPPLQAIDKGISGARARLALQRPAGALKVAYTVTRSRTEAEHLLNFSTHFRTVSPVSREDSDAYQAFKLAVGNLRSPRRFYEQVRSGSLPEGVGTLMWRLLKGTPEILSVIYYEALRKPKRLALYTQSEQAPNPESRITLDPDRRDALGTPQLRLDWKLSRIDKDSITRAQQIVGDQLEKAGLGRLVPGQAFTEDNNNWGSNIRGGHHHLGTARMSTDPARGVVDSEGQAHTVRDLYIADSSVFPTGGFANPLLTTAAWAVRVADTIGRKYA